MDRFPCSGEVKGSTVPLRHDTFVITSNLSIDELFTNDQMMIEPIRRRCRIYHFSRPYDRPPVIQGGSGEQDPRSDPE